MKAFTEYIFLQQGMKEVFLVTPFNNGELIKITVYPFKEEYVELIPEDAQYGNYRIGCFNGSMFWVQYFGRSDDNEGGLRQRVKDHLSDVTDHKERLYDDTYYFWFSVAPNMFEAFKQECRDYHTFPDLDDGKFVDNDIHPARPNGQRCPICNE